MKIQYFITFLLVSATVTAQNVGIGTNAPTNKLDINGSLRLRETSYSLNGASPSVTIATDISQVLLTTGTSPTGTASLTTTTPQTGQHLVIYNSSSIPATLNGATIAAGEAMSFVYSNTGWRAVADGAADDWRTVGNAGTSAGTNFIGTTDAVDLVAKTNNTERLRLLNGSNTVVMGTGEGTATVTGATLRAPDAAGTNIVGRDLTIRGGNGTGTAASGSIFVTGGGTNTGSSGNAYVRGGTNLAGGTGNVYLNDQAGLVGIGSAAPTQLLTMGSSTNSTTVRLSQRSPNASSTYRFNVMGLDPVNGPYISWDNNLDFRFSTATDDGGGGWTERMRIASGGNVSIGYTTAPAYKLDVNGDIRAATTYRTTSGFGNILQVGDDAWIADINSGNFMGVVGQQNANEGGMRLGGNGNAYFYSNNTSNIGLGTTTPSNLLSISAGNTQGIDIGKPNDQLNVAGGGSYQIRFWGYRDVVNNAIGAKISAERTYLCCSGSGTLPWLSQGTDLAFYTNPGLTTSGASVTSPADNSTERLRIKDNGQIMVAGSQNMIEYQKSSCNSDNCLITSFGGKTYPVASWQPALIGFNAGSASGISQFYPFAATWENSGGNWGIRLDYNGTSDGSNTKTVQVMFIRKEIAVIPSGSSFP